MNSKHSRRGPLSASTQQLLLPFAEQSPRISKENFAVSISNQEAVDWIQNWPQWPTSVLIIYGPSACGKTHLGCVWEQTAHASRINWNACHQQTPLEWVQQNKNIVIDNAHCIKGHELFLLQLYNLVHENKGSLLLLASTPPHLWGLSLADLRSRLNSTPAIRISMPDETLLQAIIKKLFSDLQMEVSTEAINYILRRTERSVCAVKNIALKINEQVLIRKRQPSFEFIKELRKDLFLI